MEFRDKDRLEESRIHIVDVLYRDDAQEDRLANNSVIVQIPPLCGKCIRSASSGAYEELILVRAKMIGMGLGVYIISRITKLMTEEPYR